MHHTYHEPGNLLNTLRGSLTPLNPHDKEEVWGKRLLSKGGVRAGSPDVEERGASGAGRIWIHTAGPGREAHSLAGLRGQVPDYMQTQTDQPGSSQLLT